MRKNQGRSFLAAYGLWCFAIFAIVIYGQHFTNHGEYGVSAHIWLILSGFPLSLATLALPNGSLLSVVAAGLLGFTQWALVIHLYMGQRNAKKP